MGLTLYALKKAFLKATFNHKEQDRLCISGFLGERSGAS